jgi:hypothetical protein
MVLLMSNLNPIDVKYSYLVLKYIYKCGVSKRMVVRVASSLHS